LAVRDCTRYICTFLFILAALSIIYQPCCFAGVADFLCERGIYLYDNGDYVNAFREFKKALLIEPENRTAIAYIGLIKEAVIGERQEKDEPVIPDKFALEDEEDREKAIKEALEQVEGLLVFPKGVSDREDVFIPLDEEVFIEKKIFERRPPDILILDQEIWATQPDTLLEIALGKTFVIQGSQIRRFLVISPEVLQAQRKTADTIEVKPIKLGTSFLHVWDNTGRWTFKIQNIIPRPEGPTLDEIQRKEKAKGENFKINYSFSRDAFYLGTKPSNLERESLSFNQWLGLEGETPYGKFRSSARIAKLQNTTDLTYLSTELLDGHIGSWEDFDLRGFDYNIYGSELGLPGTNLRGLRYDQRLDWQDSNYTLFWGREGQGTFGRLSPGLSETRDSFLEGGRFFSRLSDNLDYQLGYYRGYGDERDGSLHEESVDLTAKYDTEKWKFSAQGGYDSEKFAYLLDSVFIFPELRIRTEYRNIYPGYVTAIGTPSRLGEMGGLTYIEYAGIKNLVLTQRADFYQDRLFPNTEHPDMWNMELDTYANYRLGPSTVFNANFRFWDEKGKVSPRREKSFGGGISQNLDLIKRKDLTLYSNYQYEETKNFDSITSDYEKHRVTAGARLRLFDGFSTYASSEYNWLEDISPNTETNPQAWEAGFDYNHQVGNTPVYTNLRADYRDERATSSTHSFLAGEDSVEIQGGLSYKPWTDWELFVDGRYRKVWPETEGESIYTEGEFLTGARLVFDTGLSWEPVGDIYGVVFKDVDGDGLQEDGEPGIEGVKVFLGKDKFELTDDEGKFTFFGTRAKAVYLTVDLSSAPSGFVPSTPTTREFKIKHGGIGKVVFGLTFRSEIVGSVFIDKNKNGKFDHDEVGQTNVLLFLEDGTKVRSNDRGRFYFRKVSVGEHVLSFDVNSIPINLLPKVPIKKEMSLTEGMSYTYDIPLEPLE